MTAVSSLGASLMFAAVLAGAAATTGGTPAPATAPTRTQPADAAPIATSTPAERLQVYRDFRSLFDAQKFSDAIAPAEKLVAMTEEATTPNDPSLAAPLINLGTTQYQTSDYAAAETNYLRAIKIIEQAQGGFATTLIPPLRGLGLTYLAAGQPQAAVEPLRRGVDIIRKVDGLFNENQLELLDPLIRTYVQMNQNADAEREAIYSYRVSENRFGRNSVEVVPALEKLARWYSDIGRNTTARQYFARAFGILQKSLPATDARKIAPLRGIADTYRLEYIYGPELSGEQQIPTGAGSSALGASVGTAPQPQEYNPTGMKLDPAGEAALRSALAIAEAARPNIDEAQHADILIDLGDWLLLDGDKQAAMDSYRQAWPHLKDLEAPQNAALAEPSQIIYRPPLTAYRSQRAKPENIVEGYVDVEFTVNADGRVSDEHTVEKSASDTQERAVLNAIKKARYRPRFEQGEAVVTKAVRYRQLVYSVKASSKTKN